MLEMGAQSLEMGAKLLEIGAKLLQMEAKSLQMEAKLMDMPYETSMIRRKLATTPHRRNQINKYLH